VLEVVGCLGHGSGSGSGCEEFFMNSVPYVRWTRCLRLCGRVYAKAYGHGHAE